MAPAPRKSTGRAASAKAGAASAVPTNPTDDVVSEEPITVKAPAVPPVAHEPVDTPITVDAANPPTTGEREARRAELATENAAAQQTAQLDEPAAPVAPAPRTIEDPSAVASYLNDTPMITEGVGGEVGAVEQPGQQDLAAIRAIADTSGLEPATPYPADGIAAPAPVVVLPPLRKTQNWVRADDSTATLTCRVLADGWKVPLDGNQRFAQRGDRITAPADIVRRAAERRVVIIEEE